MLKFDKWYLPEGEQHLQGWMRKVNKRVDGRLTYQYGKYEFALQFVKEKRVALDIGAHVGLWSWFMARDFEAVACFEPMPEHRECWQLNMMDKYNAELFEFGLGEQETTAAFGTRTKGSSGDTGVLVGLSGTIKVLPLDKLAFPVVDFIKIDTEGYELAVLKGAEKTLLRSKPCIIVEQKGDLAKKYGFEQLGAVKYLESLGAVHRGTTSGDYVLSWD